MMTDVGTGALMARAGLMGAAYNVRINLKSIRDPGWAGEVLARLASAAAEGEAFAKEAEEFMEKALDEEP